MGTPNKSASSRRQGRESAMQVLYLTDVCQLSVDDVPEAVLSETPLTPKTRQFVQHLARGVVEKQSHIDPILNHYAENWELLRMAAVDRCILRLAAFELLYDLETPVNVVINEAVEIAKIYSTADSGKFVNGILDKVKNERKTS